MQLFPAVSRAGMQVERAENLRQISLRTAQAANTAPSRGDTTK